MKDQLTISLLQKSLYWEQPAANRASFEELMWPLRGKTDVIVLPEMFTTGFTMNNKAVFETMNLHTHKWMRQMASQTGAAITGSLIIREENQYFNRLFWVQPDGNEYFYDKKHLFRMADEHQYYQPGKKSLNIEYLGWKFRPIICYDLRFPEWCRNKFSENTGLEYDVLITVANWPAARETAWDTLLKARAVENHCYSVGVNRVGTDGNNIEYSGHSAVYNPKGVAELFTDNKEGVFQATLDKSSLLSYREKFPSFLDADL